MFKPIFVQDIAKNIKSCKSDKYAILDSVKMPTASFSAGVQSKKSSTMFEPSKMSAGNTKGTSGDISTYINEIAKIGKEGQTSTDIPSAYASPKTSEEVSDTRIAYQKFLSEGFAETHYFPYAQFLCPQNEIKKITAQLTDFTFLFYCGRGQFGSVWLVKDLSEQIVALKLIPKKAFTHLEAEKDGLIAYRNKIKNFEHLVQIYHVGQTKDFFYYTMEAAYSVSDEYYIPITLSSLFEHCLFSPKDSADISLDILEGLQLLHSNNLAHRDIKPGNIILVDNKIKICDVSLIAGKDKRSTAGTEYFMPQDIDEIPEEHFGIDCDLFATGKVLYAMLSNNENILMFPHIDRKILCDKLARKINLIVNKACSPSYKDRYSSSLDFIQALLKAKTEPKKLLDFF